MRISDWSSDVCSSDLAIVSDRQSVKLADSGFVVVDAVEFHKLLEEGTPQGIDRAIDLYRGDLLEGIEATDPSFEEWLLMERQRLQIGRASCRERVCQYV